MIAIFFLIQLVIFNGKSYNPFPSLAEKVRYFRRDGFVDDPLVNQFFFCYVFVRHICRSLGLVDRQAQLQFHMLVFLERSKVAYL